MSATTTPDIEALIEPEAWERCERAQALIRIKLFRPAEQASLEAVLDRWPT